MRRGELTELQWWSNVNLEAQTAHLPMTKNRTARTVPPSKKAVATLAALPRTTTGVPGSVRVGHVSSIWILVQLYANHLRTGSAKAYP